MFCKSEWLDAPLYKIPRLICCPDDPCKAKYGPIHYALMKQCKKYFRFGSHNKHRKIYTSGMNRDEIGMEFTKIMELYEERGIKPKFYSADFSAFDSTQSAPILEKLKIAYSGMFEGDSRLLALEYLKKQINGSTVAYYSEADRQLKFKFKGTRASGSMDTTVGNTILGMVLTDFIIEYCKIPNNELIWAMNAGDDILIISPEGYSQFFHPKKM
jgi:hypothetical protein